MPDKNAVNTLFHQIENGIYATISSQTLSAAKKQINQIAKKISLQNQSFARELANLVVDSPGKVTELSSYSGTAWDSLSPAYRKWKAKHAPGKGFFFLSGALEGKLSSFDVESVFGKVSGDARQSFYTAGRREQITYNDGMTVAVIRAPAETFVKTRNPVTGSDKFVTAGGQFIKGSVELFVASSLSQGGFVSLGRAGDVQTTITATIYPFGQGFNATDNRRLHTLLAQDLGSDSGYKVAPWTSKSGKEVFRPFLKEFTLWWVDTKIRRIVRT